MKSDEKIIKLNSQGLTAYEDLNTLGIRKFESFEKAKNYCIQKYNSPKSQVLFSTQLSDVKKTDVIVDVPSTITIKMGTIHTP